MLLALCNDMEEAQRTVKVLHVDLHNSFPNGMIENMSSLRETMQLNLVKMKLPVKLLVGSVINVTSKVITNSTVPIAIIAATKDKKIEIEKFMRASAKKVVFKWPSLLYAYQVDSRRLRKIPFFCQQANPYTTGS